MGRQGTTGYYFAAGVAGCSSPRRGERRVTELYAEFRSRARAAP